MKSQVVPRTLVVLLVSAAASCAHAPQEPQASTPPSAEAAPKQSVAQAAPRDPFGHADLTGYWKNDRSTTKPIGNIAKDLPGFALPYTPAGEAAHRHNVNETVDPEGVCLPSGIPRQSASALPFAIIQSKNKVAFLYWQNNYRVVFVDGRAHPDDPDPQYFGHAVGHWEGDSLVIDSVGFKDSLTSETWSDENADAHSDALHTIERWTRVDAGHLAHEITIEDPKYLTHPVKYSRVYLAVPEGQEFGEYICDENNLDRSHLGPGPGPIRPDGTRGYATPQLPDTPPPPEFYEKR